MMHFRRFPSKKALKTAIAATPGGLPSAERYFEETSLFGTEYRDNGTFCVCMDHPKRSVFANITVKDGRITGVR